MKSLLLYILVPLPVLSASIALAQNVALDSDQLFGDAQSGWLPYAFSTDSMGNTLGVAAFTAGKLQPQSSLFGSAYASSNDSWGLVGAMRNIRLPSESRVFLDTFLFAGHFSDSRYYIDLDGNPAQPQAGSNDSLADDFVSGISNDAQMEFTLKYVFPMGDAIEQPLSIYYLDSGLLKPESEVATTWNPLQSGKTRAELSLFWALSRSG